MKSVKEMMEALKEIGNEWHKGNMHRFYINLKLACEVYYNREDTKHARLPLNRFERENGKCWIDMETGEIKTKDIKDAEDMVDGILELVG